MQYLLVSIKEGGYSGSSPPSSLDSSGIRIEVMGDKGKPDIMELIRRHELAKRAEGKSPKTLKGYKELLLAFHRYVTEHTGDTTIGRFTIDNVRGYLLYLQTRPKFQGHPFTPARGTGLSREAISVRPCDIVQDSTGWTVKVKGKGNKMAKVAISPTLAAQLQAYAYRSKLDETDRLFPITRSQAFRIVTTAFDRAGLTRPRRELDRVGAVHILRHSGAIERLRQTGNPKAVQDQLRHKSALMTMRYLKTLSHEESLQIQQGVDFKW